MFTIWIDFYYYFLFITWALGTAENGNVLQQKGLEDYKLATANASMNADFSEERVADLNHAIANISLEGGDVVAKPQAAATEDNKKQQPPPKEVWI